MDIVVTQEYLLEVNGCTIKSRKQKFSRHCILRRVLSKILAWLFVDIHWVLDAQVCLPSWYDLPFPLYDASPTNLQEVYSTRNWLRNRRTLSLQVYVKMT